jgi:hypothetical protein
MYSLKVCDPGFPVVKEADTELINSNINTEKVVEKGYMIKTCVVFYTNDHASDNWNRIYMQEVNGIHSLPEYTCGQNGKSHATTEAYYVLQNLFGNDRTKNLKDIISHSPRYGEHLHISKADFNVHIPIVFRTQKTYHLIFCIYVDKLVMNRSKIGRVKTMEEVYISRNNNGMYKCHKDMNRLTKLIIAEAIVPSGIMLGGALDITNTGKLRDISKDHARYKVGNKYVNLRGPRHQASKLEAIMALTSEQKYQLQTPVCAGVFDSIDIHHADVPFTERNHNNPIYVLDLDMRGFKIPKGSDIKSTFADIVNNVFYGRYGNNLEDSKANIVCAMWDKIDSLVMIQTPTAVRRILYRILPNNRVGYFSGIMKYILEDSGCNVIKDEQLFSINDLCLLKFGVDCDDKQSVKTFLESGSAKKWIGYRFKNFKSLFKPGVNAISMRNGSSVKLFWCGERGTFEFKFSMDIFRFVFSYISFNGDDRFNDGDEVRKFILDKFLMEYVSEVWYYNVNLQGDTDGEFGIMSQIHHGIDRKANQYYELYKDMCTYTKNEFFIWDMIGTLEILKNYKLDCEIRHGRFLYCVDTLSKFFDDMLCSFVFSRLVWFLEPRSRRNRDKVRCDPYGVALTVENKSVKKSFQFYNRDLSNIKAPHVDRLQPYNAVNAAYIPEVRALTCKPHPVFLLFAKNRPGYLTCDERIEYIESVLSDDEQLTCINRGKIELNFNNHQ